MMIIAWKIITRPKTSTTWQNIKSRRQILLGIITKPKTITVRQYIPSPRRLLLRKIITKLKTVNVWQIKQIFCLKVKLNDFWQIRLYYTTMEITIQKPMENIIYASSHEIYTLFLLIIKAHVNYKLTVCYLSYRAVKSDNKGASPNNRVTKTRPT